MESGEGWEGSLILFFFGMSWNCNVNSNRNLLLLSLFFVFCFSIINKQIHKRTGIWILFYKNYLQLTFLFLSFFHEISIRVQNSISEYHCTPITKLHHPLLQSNPVRKLHITYLFQLFDQSKHKMFFFFAFFK